jgi:hypothetical protein
MLRNLELNFLFPALITVALAVLLDLATAAAPKRNEVNTSPPVSMTEYRGEHDAQQSHAAQRAISPLWL